LEDAQGNRAVLVTTDLLGFPKGISDRIRNRVEKKYDLTRAQILLNSSHTHSAPVLEDALTDIYPLDQRHKKQIQKYTHELEDKIVALVGRALQAMQPAALFAQNGVTRFQVNRRNNPAATLTEATDLNGPNDHAVPVIKVSDPSGKLIAIAFGYACHNTVLDGYTWSGDYAGFAQLEIEKMYPGVVALFFQGAGADQNPLPRRTVPLAQQYGRTLAAAVDRVLQEEMRALAPTLLTAYKEVELTLNSPPTREELARQASETTGYHQRWATRMIGNVEKGDKLRTTYPYPLQVWKLGDQSIFSLGGELVIGYAIQLKRIFGQEIFVLGYSNDVMAYIPTTAILREGGYEGESSQIVYGLPNTWTSDIETEIIYGMISLAGQVGVLKAK
jgi:Neutral/alkaline non-lysosomal ceramidase.